MSNNKKKFTNPFKGKDKAKVWKELSEKSKPISKEAFINKIKEAQKKNTDK
ncbi:MAG: hypothetical protein ACFB0B_01785 [Thermonemataceae bacterium]